MCTVEEFLVELNLTANPQIKHVDSESQRRSIKAEYYWLLIFFSSVVLHGKGQIPHTVVLYILRITESIWFSFDFSCHSLYIAFKFRFFYAEIQMTELVLKAVYVRFDSSWLLIKCLVLPCWLGWVELPQYSPTTLPPKFLPLLKFVIFHKHHISVQNSLFFWILQLIPPVVPDFNSSAFHLNRKLTTKLISQCRNERFDREINLVSMFLANDGECKKIIISNPYTWINFLHLYPLHLEDWTCITVPRYIS